MEVQPKLGLYVIMKCVPVVFMYENHCFNYIAAGLAAILNLTGTYMGN